MIIFSFKRSNITGHYSQSCKKQYRKENTTSLFWETNDKSLSANVKHQLQRKPLSCGQRGPRRDVASWKDINKIKAGEIAAMVLEQQTEWVMNHIYNRADRRTTKKHKKLNVVLSIILWSSSRKQKMVQSIHTLKQGVL